MVTLERPTVAHLIHKEPQLDDMWRELAIRFAEFIVRGAANCRSTLPQGVSAVLPLCHQLAQMPELRWRNRGADAAIGQMAMQFIPAITTNVASVPAKGDTPGAASGDIVPANVFRRFEDRLSAGEALERAKRLERDGRSEDARGAFQYAFEPNAARCGPAVGVRGVSTSLRRAFRRGRPVETSY